jgi:hypothetical protein
MMAVRARRHTQDPEPAQGEEQAVLRVGGTVRRMPGPAGPPERCPSEVSREKSVLRHPVYQDYVVKGFGVCRFQSHAGESEHEPGIGCGHPVVGRRG